MKNVGRKLPEVWLRVTFVPQILVIGCFVPTVVRLSAHIETVIVQSYFGLRVMQITSKPMGCRRSAAQRLGNRRILVISGYCPGWNTRALVSLLLSSVSSSSEA